MGAPLAENSMAMGLIQLQLASRQWVLVRMPQLLVALLPVLAQLPLVIKVLLWGIMQILVLSALLLEHLIVADNSTAIGRKTTAQCQITISAASTTAFGLCSTAMGRKQLLVKAVQCVLSFWSL